MAGADDEVARQPRGAVSVTDTVPSCAPSKRPKNQPSPYGALPAMIPTSNRSGQPGQPLTRIL